MERYLAIDIGASSGRHLVGWKEDEKLVTKEVFRFPNGPKEENGHLVWDIEALFRYVCEGIDIAISQFSDIVSFSIDSWGLTMSLCVKTSHSFPALPIETFGQKK